MKNQVYSEEDSCVLHLTVSNEKYSKNVLLQCNFFGCYLEGIIFSFMLSLNV